ncbi:phage holin family protein [Dactylosporangium aurantiacum]|uniref:Phage holin family protein n=1 Tax=Dactylosporangium aurantiacum TaxID=35754 RepID=A0A9Q9MJH6_9ACTN|nr:phage holin family protein [Dactylosporangium aurantiacum]MDG6103580.1 phage holin family protein [Dactylosporangium aurantiacum]UWZ51927.1 phage holin family protein [Dactylosporangium aurantiacum]
MSAPGYGRAVPPEEPGSLGEIISDISEGLSNLFRQEVELAKAELRAEASKAGKAAGMFSGAGIAGLLTALMLSLALTYALDNVMPLGWAAFIVAVLWAVVAAALFAAGRKQARTVSPVPRRTVETLKEDAKWLKHPTTSETTSS